MQSTSPYFNAVTLTPEQIRQYNNKGYLLLDATITPQGVEAMLEECMVAWRKEKGEFEKEL